MSDQPPVRLDVDADGIATLTLNRPEQLNAFDLKMIEAWRAALEAAEADERIKVVLVTGAGRAFCAGGDFEEMRGRGPDLVGELVGDVGGDFAGGARHAALHRAGAERLGRQMADQGIRLVYGGGRIGLMGVLADAVIAGGGEAVGVIPEHLESREVGHRVHAPINAPEPRPPG